MTKFLTLVRVNSETGNINMEQPPTSVSAEFLNLLAKEFPEFRSMELVSGKNKLVLKKTL